MSQNTGDKYVICFVACILSQCQIVNELLAVLIIHITKCICRDSASDVFDVVGGDVEQATMLLLG